MTDTSSLPPPLDDYRHQFLVLRDEVHELVESLDDRSFNWSPDDRSWSIGQCLSHLCIVDRGNTKRLEKAIDRALAEGPWRRRGKAGPVRYDLFTRLFLAAMEPPVRWRLKAPSVSVPASDLQLEAVLKSFLAINERLLGALEKARTIDLRRAKMRSPLAGWLKVSVGAVFAFLAAHDRRHLWQCRQIKRAPEFPT